MEESFQGYPTHRWLAVGHLAEASAESLDQFPALAEEIRKHRLAYMEDANYKVPVVELIDKATRLAGGASGVSGLGGLGGKKRHLNARPTSPAPRISLPPRVPVTPSTGGYRYSGQFDNETEAEFFERMRRAQRGERPKGTRTRIRTPLTDDTPEPDVPPLVILTTCDRCGRPAGRSDKFCAGCGARISQPSWVNFNESAPPLQVTRGVLVTQARPVTQARQATQATQARSGVVSASRGAAAMAMAAARRGMAGGLGQTADPSQAGEISPLRVPRTPKHSGPLFRNMTWGPPIKYVKIPGGEWGTVATLKVMKELVLGKWGHRNPEVVLLAKKIVAGVSPGPTKDYQAMADAILDFMKTRVKYELDPSGLEWVQTPHYTLLVSGSGDCDDLSVATDALAMSLGFRAAFRTVKGDHDRPEQWSHVYPVIGISVGREDLWLTADATQKESYLGWDPPEAKLHGMKTWVIDPQTSEGASWED